MMPSPLTACLTFLKTQIKAFRPFLVYSFTQTQGQGGGGGGRGNGHSTDPFSPRPYFYLR